jgi:hypothetical protein
VKGEGFRRLEEEVRRARAEALGRAGERLEDGLARLAALDRQVDVVWHEPEEAPGREARLAAVAAARARVRAEVVRLRQHLLIQREALGLRRHVVVDELYPLPPSAPDH